MKLNLLNDILNEIYISIDIETLGPILGVNSMIQLGAAAFTPDGSKIGTFLTNIIPLPESVEDPDTMSWWGKEKNYPMLLATKENSIPADQAMEEFYYWLIQYKNPVAVCYPAGFDFMFVYWYLIRFVGRSPFSFSALDIKTMAMTMMQSSYRKSTKRHMPKKWMSDKPHTHNALDDAIEQGEMFINMLHELHGI